MKTLTATDRKSLIRLASSLPKGSEERRAILAGLKSASVRTAHMGAPRDFFPKPGEDKVEHLERILRDYPGPKRSRLFDSIKDKAMPLYSIEEYDYIDEDESRLEWDMYIVQSSRGRGKPRKADPKKSDEMLLESIERLRRKKTSNAGLKQASDNPFSDGDKVFVQLDPYRGPTIWKGVVTLREAKEIDKHLGKLHQMSEDGELEKVLRIDKQIQDLIDEKKRLEREYGKAISWARGMGIWGHFEKGGNTMIPTSIKDPSDKTDDNWYHILEGVVERY